VKSTFTPRIKRPRIQLSATVKVISIYLICALAAFTLLGMLSVRLGGDVYGQFYALVFLLLGLGGLHLWLMYKYFEWEERALLKQIVFTLGVNIAGCIVLYLIFNNQLGEDNGLAFAKIFSWLGLIFGFPFFYYLSWKHFFDIPDRVYKSFVIQTFDDVDRTIPFEENERGLILTFEKQNRL